MGLPILGSEQYGCHGEILERLMQLFNHVTVDHCDVVFMRFDVRLPQFGIYPQDNSLIMKFTADFITYLTRKKLDPHYLWVREQKSSERPHWHFCVLWNRKWVQSIYKPLKKAEEIWARKLKFGDLREGAGLIDYCLKDKFGNPQQNGLMIRRNSADFQEMYNRCFQWGSYLAKASQKSMNHGYRTFGCSRL
jgi:hypothetical protein